MVSLGSNPGQKLVRFVLHILTGQVAKHRTVRPKTGHPGNPTK